MQSYRTRIYQQYLSSPSSEPVSFNTVIKPRASYFNSLIRRHFPKNKNAAILDLGCGHGGFLYYIQKAGYANALGMDASPQQVEQAKQFGVKHVMQGNLLEEMNKLDPQSLDLAVAFDVIEHFVKDEIVTFVDQVARILKPKGKWIIHVPNGDSPFCSSMVYKDFTHETAFTWHSITQLLNASGFSKVACYEDKPVIHGIRSLIRAFLWWKIRMFWRFLILVEKGTAADASILTQCFLTVAEK